MRLDKILAGAAFRSALMFLPAFVIVLVAVGAYVLNVSNATLYDELEAQIGEELILFGDIHASEGLDELVTTVDSLNRGSVSKQRIAGVFSPDGKPLGGNATRLPQFTGWGLLSELSDPSGGTVSYYGTVVDFGDCLIVVGRTTRHIAATQRSLMEALLVAGVLVTLIALAIGFTVSRRTGAKLDIIADTLEKVSRGDTEIRLPVGRQDDQIDRISALINRHLERLSQLMGMTRNTIVAIAHDLKSPLNRASLSLQQALMELPAERDDEHPLERALTDLEHVGSVFDTMLRIGRISATDDQAGFVRFPIAPLLVEMAETYEPVVEGEGQTLVLDMDDRNTAAILGDRKMIMQMLANLIENASRYAGGGARIRLALTADETGTAIEVADTGPGIPPERHEDVLQPFHRLATGGHDQGTGLGLALVQAIATRHRAALTLADNHPGLRVTVRFPARPFHVLMDSKRTV